MIKVALPKGRLGNKVYALLERAGYSCPELFSDNRKLIFEGNGAVYFLAKPSDVARYVEYGAADVGFVGKDILMEEKPDLYEYLDLGIGKCRLMIAGKPDYKEDNSRPLKVATKFPNIANDYFSDKSREIEIIKLDGSIELAPIVGLSDVILDIVETGNTLRENNMVILEEVAPVSTRMVANKSSSKFLGDEIRLMVEKLKQVTDNDKNR